MKPRLAMWSALLTLAAVAPPAGAVHPVAAFAAEYLLGKVIDEGFDTLSGKPNLKVLDQRLRELEANAAVQREVRDEVRKLREGLNDRVTVTEFRKLAAGVTKEIETIQVRLDEVEERVELLEVRTADAEGKTAHAADPKHFLARAAAHERGRKSYQAVACYNIAGKLGKPDVDLHVGRGAVYLRMGAAGVAAADASEALRLNDKHPAAYALAGHARLATGEDQAAVAAFTACLKYDPARADAHLGRATAFGRLGKKGEAAADLAAGLKLDPAGTWFLAADKPLTGVRSERYADLAASKTLAKIAAGGQMNAGLSKALYGVEDADVTQMSQAYDGGVALIRLARPKKPADVAAALQGKDELGREVRYEPSTVGVYTVHRPYDAFYRRKRAEFDAIRNPSVTDKLNMGFLKEIPPISPAFALLADGVLLVGSPDAVTAVLTRKGPPDVSPGLAAAIRTADFAAPVCWVVDTDPLQKEKPPEIPGVDTAAAVKAVEGGAAVFTVRLDDRVRVTVGVVCRDEAAAGVVAKEGKAGLKAVPGLLKGVPEKAAAAITAVINVAEVSTSKNVTELKLAVTPEQVVEVLANLK